MRLELAARGSSARCRCTPRGKPTTMPAKMRRLIPLPMPRSVICSPSHMMKAVPVVRVSTVMSLKPMPGLLDDAGSCWLSVIRSR